MKTRPIVLGTAGHIDHGKTSLVRALTGTDTDRLKEEKERGITIELGFASVELGEHRFGFVDVPGHERFIKSMVAGAAGIDLVVLVIAADEGIMPQTREHLDICELLGVRRGIVALTKSDVVDSEWCEMVSEELSSSLQGTFLADAPIVAVSAKTGEGLDRLRSTLESEAAKVEPRASDGLFRIPVDRVFVKKGFGTVITGTTTGGTLAIGDEVEVHPQGQVGKVRTIQVHGDSVERVEAGLRCALNLTGLERADLQRGNWIAKRKAIEPSHIIDVEFSYLKSAAKALPQRSRVLLHHGTAQIEAALVLSDEQLMPGETGYAQLRFDLGEALAALPDDHFVCRGFVRQANHGTTIGGGRVVRVHAPKLRQKQQASVESLSAAASAEDDQQRLYVEVGGFGALGVAAETLRSRLGWNEQHLQKTLNQLTHKGRLIRFGSNLHCQAETFESLRAVARNSLAEFHKNNPRKRGMSMQELRMRLGENTHDLLRNQVIEQESQAGTLVISEDVAGLANHAASFDPASTPLGQKLLGALSGWGVESPSLAGICEKVGEDKAVVRDVLASLVTAGEVVKVQSDYFVSKSVADSLRDKLAKHFESSDQLTTAEWKEMTGASRKFSIPLAEYFDRQRVTRRDGNVRVAVGR